MVRVDQAGEYGATRIYCGQLAVLGPHPPSRPIARMQSQEERHLRTFDEMMVERGIRPTLLQPVWHVAGHALGAATALMSPSAAMACTAAVETEIDRHYSEQLRALGEEDPDLADTIRRVPRRGARASRHRARRRRRGRVRLSHIVFPHPRGLSYRHRAVEKDLNR